MRTSIRISLLALTIAAPLSAQSTTSAPPWQIYGSYARLTNSFNGLPGAQQGLNGWSAGVAFPAWHSLRLKIDVSGFNGKNAGAQQKAISFTGGGQYEHMIHRERLFAEALFGDVGLNRYWGPNGSPGESASFTTLLGGGLDTPINPHFAFRVEGDYRFTNFALIQAVNSAVPYRVPGLPKNFADLRAGIVWIPRLGVTRDASSSSSDQPHRPESELVFEDLNSFGHIHIFANSWWSYLHVAGIEYDRHSWGRFIGARMDYSAEFLPFVLLQQPSVTDAWGNPKPVGVPTKNVPGFDFAPIGLRMMWRDGKAIKPYYFVKGGIIAFTQKSISQYGSYFDFSLHQSLGVQVQLNQRYDFRAGVGVFHFSNGFMVPSNPGLDSLSYNFGLAYHLGQHTTGR